MVLLKASVRPRFYMLDPSDPETLVLGQFAAIRPT
jgi:hypothetical protein